MDMTLDLQDSASVGATVNSITLTATADTTTFAPLTFSSDSIRTSGSARPPRIGRPPPGPLTLSLPTRSV